MNCQEFFSVDFNTADNNDILDIHKDLMKKKIIQNNVSNNFKKNADCIII